MISRRRFFSLIAGAVAAPKAILAAPLRMKYRQSGISAPNGSGGYQFGFTGFKELKEAPSDGSITLEMLQRAYAQATFGVKPPNQFYYSLPALLTKHNPAKDEEPNGTQYQA